MLPKLSPILRIVIALSFGPGVVGCSSMKSNFSSLDESKPQSTETTQAVDDFLETYQTGGASSGEELAPGDGRMITGIQRPAIAGDDARGSERTPADLALAAAGYTEARLVREVRGRQTVVAKNKRGEFVVVELTTTGVIIGQRALDFRSGLQAKAAAIPTTPVLVDPAPPVS
jgi:hypothetical protein